MPSERWSEILLLCGRGQDTIRRVTGSEGDAFSDRNNRIGAMAARVRDAHWRSIYPSITYRRPHPTHLAFYSRKCSPDRAVD